MYAPRDESSRRPGVRVDPRAEPAAVTTTATPPRRASPSANVGASPSQAPHARD